MTPGKSRFIRTDLAFESVSPEEAVKGRGLDYREKTEDGFQVSTLKVTTSEGEAIIGKPIGKYVSVDVGKIWLSDDDLFSRASSLVSEKLRDLISGVSDKPDPSVLVVGLGNRFITSDAIGPLSVRDVTVTRHIKGIDTELFDKMGSLCVSAFTPGVVGQTGIETTELIKGAVESASPSVVIAIDALAARSVDRLATTVQLSDTGIMPGSGMGNRRRGVTESELGVPVVSIGVPTVVDSSTLVTDMLEEAGIEGLPQDLEERLENGRSFFVTLKDGDVAISEMARLISASVNLALSVAE